MADFAAPPLSRDQLVLFPEKLDQAIPPDHAVRLLDDILNKVDWTLWEKDYDLRRGQPPIHPKIIAGVVLYGLLKRIRTSRALEEAIEVRNDFRWFVEGRSIDHTTICKFRQRNAGALKDLFVQISLVARELGHLPLASLGFDGTRLRANNRKTGTRTPEELRRSKAELEKKFAELEAKAAEADAEDDQRLGEESGHKLAEELADTKRRRQRVDAALAEVERLEQAGEKVPNRIPITDPQSRVTPNKDGGFAPNYTPHATVDIDSGLVVSADVIPSTDEDKHMISAVQDVQKSFGLEKAPGELLADGMMSTGENLVRCEELEIDFYSPIKLGCENNPADREDPRQPVAESDWDRLPTSTSKRGGTKTSRLNKNAFVYDAQSDCYWCPAGKELTYRHQTSQMENGRRRIFHRYESSAESCQGCPLASRCLGRKSKTRGVSHGQHETNRRQHAEKMKTAKSQAKYARRRSPGERPFAVIKGQYGARQFLSRSLERVRNEWLWLVSAFNLDRLLSLYRSGPGPPPQS